MPTIKRYGKIEGGLLASVADERLDDGDWRPLNDVYPDQEPGAEEALSGPVIDVQPYRITRAWTIGPKPADVLADDRRRRRDTALPQALAMLERHRTQRDFGLPTTLTDDQATAWAVYLQGLRDYPETGVWPEKPA